MTERRHNAFCPLCETQHTVTAETHDREGYFAECSVCIDKEHVKFMRTTGKRLGLKCVKGCKCGRG